MMATLKEENESALQSNIIGEADPDHHTDGPTANPIPPDSEAAHQARTHMTRTHSTSKTISDRYDLNKNSETNRMEKTFHDEDTTVREKVLKTAIIDVKDSGLDYTMINMSTIDDINEELMLKPLINVSVIGRIDNLKYNIEYCKDNRERIRKYSEGLKKRMGAFRDLLNDGQAKRKLIGTLTDLWKQIEQGLTEYEQDQSSLIIACKEQATRSHFLNKKFKSESN